MVYTDPYTPDGSLYECRECGYRTSTNENPGTCPQCSGSVKNLAVTQE